MNPLYKNIVGGSYLVMAVYIMAVACLPPQRFPNACCHFSLKDNWVTSSIIPLAYDNCSLTVCVPIPRLLIA
jgi:hypothetical protein